MCDLFIHQPVLLELAILQTGHLEGECGEVCSDRSLRNSCRSNCFWILSAGSKLEDGKSVTQQIHPDLDERIFVKFWEWVFIEPIVNKWFCAYCSLVVDKLVLSVIPVDWRNSFHWTSVPRSNYVHFIFTFHFLFFIFHHFLLFLRSLLLFTIYFLILLNLGGQYSILYTCFIGLDMWYCPLLVKVSQLSFLDLFPDHKICWGNFMR